ncbi:hypothetical protein AMJ86_04635 [bacterium SM23_57]|jgi:hypothetical protein|nr:MAG: hypothetical protein AMJ86_04635 [bacterium SM23_57]
MSAQEKSIIKNQKRARTIQLWCIIGLMIAIGLYFAFHLWIFDNPGYLLPVRWYHVTTKSGISERALDWTLWGLIGTFIYLLSEITYHYRDIEKNAPVNQSFMAYTPWYISTLLKGPFTVLVIMLFFNAANINLTGTNGDTPAIAFKFSELDHRVSVALAFILGYYGRVGREVLNGIVKSLLPKAWAEAHENFQIKPKDAVIALGETAIFETSPKVDVVWGSSLGSIDSTGKYTSPANIEDCNKTAIITAVSTGTQSIARSASAEILPFKINITPSVELVEHGAEYTFLAPSEYQVEWTTTNGVIDRRTGVFKADPDPKVQAVTITATVTKGELKGKYSKITMKYKESDKA